MRIPAQKPAKALLYILHAGNFYGTERMALATLLGLDEYEVRVVVAPSPRGSASVAAEAERFGVRTVVFNTRWQLVVGLVPWFLRYRSIDVIGTGVAQSFICHVLASIFFVRLRQLQVVHGGTHDEHAYGKKHHLGRIGVRVVAVSNFVREKLVGYGVNPAAISVIDNFLSDMQRDGRTPRASYDPSAPTPRPVDPSRVRVSVVSRVDPIKRIDLLVDAIERHQLSSFHFDVYGTGLELDVMRSRCAALPNITVHGFVSDVEERLAGSDFLLHLCPEEPFGLVILEAFLMKLVAIVPDAGGAGGLVADGINGLRFHADDVDDFVRTLETARGMTGEALQRIADAGFEKLNTDFSQRVGVRHYREALKAGGR
jgi:glycosyltransferase involved in cell wall biosynthesis